MMILGVAGLLMALVLLVGCGDEEKTASTAQATAPECKADQKSIIPAPSGKPQHVYFYRDT